MRLTLVLSLAVLVAGISGLALPGPHGKNSSILPERDLLESDLVDDTTSKGNEGVEKRHEHEHGGFKKSKRYPVIDFPDDDDRDGGPDDVPLPDVIKRFPAIDFPDGGDSDGGPDNVPHPDQIIKRFPTIDFPDGGDSDGGPDNVPHPDQIIKRFPAIDFPDGGDSDGGPDNVPHPEKFNERDV